METEMAEFEDARALWARYRAGAAPADEPDAMMLAAYAEGRLDEGAAEQVESWLARDPDRNDLIMAARAAAVQSMLAFAPAAEIAAARALIPAAALGARTVLARGLAWSGVAASLVAACLLGYHAGSATKDQTLAALFNAAHDIGFVAAGDGFIN